MRMGTRGVGPGTVVGAAVALAFAAAAGAPAGAQVGAQVGAQPRAAGDSGRRAVAAMVARSDAFRDTVEGQMGPMRFDDLTPRRRGLAGRFVGGLSLTVSQPVGEFRQFARAGFGVALNGVAHADPAGVLGLRVEGGGVNYGRFSAPFAQQGLLIGIPARQVTSSDVYWGAIGPQVSLPLGPVRPYGFAMVGVANFTTTSRLLGAGLGGQPQTFWQATDLWNLSLMRAFGGGLRYRVSRADGTPVSFDLGARRHYVGDARYLAPGAVPGQSNLTGLTRQGRADFWTYQIGFTVGGR